MSMPVAGAVIAAAGFICESVFAQCVSPGVDAMF